MKKVLILAALILTIAGVGYAITVNPMSNVLADSASTAETIAYRDSNGDFAVKTLTVDTAVVASSVTLSSVITLYTRTKTQIDTLAATALHQLIFCTDCTIPGICKSTGTAAAQWEKIESATAGCGSNN